MFYKLLLFISILIFPVSTLIIPPYKTLNNLSEHWKQRFDQPIFFNRNHKSNIFGKTITIKIPPHGDFVRPVYILKIVLPSVRHDLVTHQFF